MRPGSSGRNAGFTLMEMLVTLVIFGVVSSLLWQALGTLARIESRLADTRQFVAREALQAEWVRQSLQGLMNGPRSDTFRFSGNARSLSGYTTMPPWPDSAGPERFQLELVASEGGRTTLLARRQGISGATALWSWEGAGNFSYLDQEGAWQSEWTRRPESETLLPRAIRLLGPGSGPLLVATQVGMNPMLRRRDVEEPLP